MALVPPRAAAGPRASERRGAAQRPDVVLLVLDEFPGDSLLDAGGRIDPVRYPNFAALASDATWFRNAYSVYDSTTKAVPLILDGRRPVPGSPADRRYHPQSIFDALARQRLPDGELRGGHRDLPAAALPRGPHPPAGDHPAAERRPRAALRPLRARAAAGAPAHVLDEARPAAARAVPLPALGRAHAARARATSCRA